jgi:hypothetical protein
MKSVYVGLFLVLFCLGCKVRDQEMEEVDKIVLLDDGVSEEFLPDNGMIAGGEEQEMLMPTIDPEEVLEEQ